MNNFSNVIVGIIMGIPAYACFTNTEYGNLLAVIWAAFGWMVASSLHDKQQQIKKYK